MVSVGSTIHEALEEEPLVEPLVELDEPEEELDDEVLELSSEPPQEARKAAAPPEASQVSIWRRCRMRSMLSRSLWSSGLW